MSGQGRDVARQVVSGSLWMIAMRWALRGIGVVSTLILARLLMPEDFGLVAIAMLVVGAVEVFGQAGLALALIRHPAPERAHYDTAWTLTILLGAAITAILWLAAPLVELAFDEPRAVPLVRILALRALIGGFENIGVVAFRKDLQFASEFRFQVAQRLLGFVTTLGLALWLRDHWALVGGILAGRALGVALSYGIHPYRPRFCLARVGDIGSFSAWMLVANVALFVQDKADEMAVGASADTRAMGTYNVAADLATAPTVEMVLPMTRALFPIFAQLAGEPQALARAYLGVFSAIAVISFSAATGIALVAHDLTLVLLGAKWVEAIPLVEMLALSGGLYALIQGTIPVISACGEARMSAALSCGRAGLMVAAVAGAAALGGGVEDIAAARVLAGLALLPGLAWAVGRVLPIGLGDLFARLWRPALAAAAMAAAVRLAHADHIPWPAVRLVLDMGVGAASFTLAMLVLWQMAGRPEGAEAAMLRGLARRFARQATRSGSNSG